MFDLSLVELLFVGVVALLVVGPQDLPKVIKAIVKAIKSVQGFSSEIKKSMNELVDETEIKQIQSDLSKEMKYIVDQNGEFQPIYDITDMLEEEDDEAERKAAEDTLAPSLSAPKGEGDEQP